LNVVQIVPCFTWAHKPRGWFIKTEGINWIHGKIIEKNLWRELMTGLALLVEEHVQESRSTYPFASKASEGTRL
jgi:hypothetical protein